jgi:cytidyltransferase-like protein
MIDKLLKKDDLVQTTGKLQKAGKCIVFTNGCFDILHVGHVRYLTAAKSEGDVLVVGLNSDTSVNSIPHAGCTGKGRRLARGSHYRGRFC